MFRQIKAALPFYGRYVCVWEGDVPSPMPFIDNMVRDGDGLRFQSFARTLDC